MLEDPLGPSAISFGLPVHINHFTVLVYGTAQTILLAVDLDGYLVDVEVVAVTKGGILTAQQIVES